MAKDIRILSTKKLLPNQKQYLLNANFNLIEADFISTKPTTFEFGTLNENLIFTSQNAVNSLLQHPDIETLKSKKVFCVGLKTKALLSDNGFDVIAYTSYAADLAEIITLVYNKESYTFFSGNLRRDTLPEALIEAKITYNEINVYETSLTPQKVSTAVNGILFFSPSGIESYLSQNKITKEVCFCIGTTTAEALENITKNIVIANHQTVENTIIQCINYYNE